MMKAPRIHISLLNFFVPRAPPSVIGVTQTRWLHRTRAPKPVPSPIPIVPDVSTFLKVIGRGLSQYADKIPSWEALFTLSTTQMRELGIEPPRTRRYLLNWLERYRKGALGPGGDFKHVENGEAILKVATTEAQDRKWVVNVPRGQEPSELSGEALARVKGYSVQGARTITGPFALPLKEGAGARVPIIEGMWEDKQGYKVDGGERRRAEVRYKKRVAQRKAEREEAGLR
ncbi:hypothetical protein SODALDRAFT_355317 [Sodiomyces alkalinus F11]|uniref:Small ribosomal subunit protein mS41 n=1 Tax=Sodiomyces alkalinus (strain CBS 110278 / VKM F-3762 / F11) TaxID=1314773 RepID=A0A3N2Q8L7_SODAK|nr:hypothetical protein SODALDRAFT_355317 [Sodiomyces alkalinus F11]ROT43121.1 hypothetical protein SODALDRAFT_355317 [Sodiomyces alkalinus F11]